MKKNIFYLFCLVFCFCITSAFASDTNKPYSAQGDFVPDEIVIELEENNSSAQAFNSLSKDNRFKIERVGDSSDLAIVKLNNVDVNSAVDELSKKPFIKNAEPNYIYRAFADIPNDPMYKYQWNFAKINANKAWKYATGKNVIVAVVDTGIAYKNYDKFKKIEDLNRANFVAPYNFITNNEHACDDNGHGSHVAGTIAQSTNNGKGVAGIAFNAKLMPVKVLDNEGFGSLSNIAEGIKYAVKHGAKVINCSLGGRHGSRILENACKYAHDKGCVVVCAAGNDGGNIPNYPAGYKYCISVSSIRYDNQLAPYSSRGTSIDIAAPGGDTTVDQNNDGKPDGIIQNTILDRDPSKNGYPIYQGTSMASPHVAGVVALVMSTGVTNPDKVTKIIKDSAYKKGLKLEDGYGAGIIDAEKAVKMAKSLQTSDCSDMKKGKKGFLGNILSLIISFVIALVIKKLLGKKSYINKFVGSTSFVLGILIGACGLFFIPFLNSSENVFLQLTSCSICSWGNVIFGNSNFAELIFFSALIPCFLMFISLPFRNLRRFSSGVSIGMGASMLSTLITGNFIISVFKSSVFISNIWLALGALLCFAFTYIYMNYIPCEE